MKNGRILYVGNPSRKLQLTGRIIYANTGEDRTLSENWGSNILKSYDTKSRKVLYNDLYGNYTGQGRSTVTTILDFRASYQIKHNLFIEAHYLNRKYDSAVDKLDYTNTVTSFGMSVGTWQRDKCFFRQRISTSLHTQWRLMRKFRIRYANGRNDVT